MNSYFRIRLINIPSIKEELFTQHSFKFGASGISEALTYSQPDLTYEPDVIPKRSHDIDIFFEKKPEENFFKGLQEIHHNLQWEIHEEAHKDWLAEWKKGFVPFNLAGPYHIVPSWCESPTTPEFSIRIDPGMAFGTGTHATTKMASYFVHKVCSQIKKPEEKSLIDVGTGTAILAMLAKKQKIGKVIGIEIDPEARRVARENIELNALEIEVPENVIEEIHEEFDIVVANIIDGILIQIKTELLKLLKPHADLFLTGILVEREELFFKEFIEKSNLHVHRRIEQDEWVGYWIKT